MIYHNERAIFVRIAERICDDILAGKYAEESRVPSVRELAAEYEVNTNTAVKAYEQLARANIIYNKRGMGYYVTPGAREQILKQRRQAFLQEQLPELFRQMRLLDISIGDVEQAWRMTIDKEY